MKQTFRWLLLAVLVGFTSLSCLGQSPNSSTEIVYKAHSLSLKMLDKDFREVTHINIGKDVYVVVDTFFRSYQVYYKDTDAAPRVMRFKFMKIEDAGLNILKVRPDNDHDNIMYLTDLLEATGTLMFNSVEAKPDGTLARFYVNKAVKTTLVSYPPKSSQR